MATEDAGNGAAWVAAVGEVGIRGVLAAGPGRPPFPRDYIHWQGGEAVPRSVSLDDQLAVTAELISRWHGSHQERVRIALATPVFGRADKGDGGRIRG